MISLTDSSSPLVITAALRGLDLRSVIGRDAAERMMEIKRVPGWEEGEDPTPPTGDDKLALSADGTLVPGRLYPPAAASESNVRYYVPGYELRMDQGRHTSSLRFRGAGDDPAGPLGWLTIEMTPTLPQDASVELKPIDHVVELRLGHRLAVSGSENGEAGATLWISLGPLDFIQAGVAICRYPFHEREEFDDLFQILTEATRDAVLQLEYRATVGQRTWNQILVSTLRYSALNSALGRKNVPRLPGTIRLSRALEAAAVGTNGSNPAPAGVRSALAMRVNPGKAVSAGLAPERLAVARPVSGAVLDQVFHNDSRPGIVDAPQSLGVGSLAFEVRVAASDIRGSRALLNHPKLNDRGGSLIVATPVWQNPGPYHPHPIALRFRQQGWTIENVDGQPFPPNSRFNLLVIDDPQALSSNSGGQFRAYIHAVSAQNLSSPGSHITHLGRSQSATSALFVTQVVDQVVDPHHAGTWFNGSAQCQTVYNEDRQSLPVGSQFHVLEFKAGGFGGLHLHVANAGNTRGHITTIDHPQTNGNPQAIVLAGHDYGDSGPYLSRAIGVWYDGSHWTVFMQDRTPMPIGVRFRVLILARDGKQANDGSGDPAEVLVDPQGEPVLVRKEVSAIHELRPFTFPLESHRYMFDVPEDPVKNRVFFPHAIQVPGEGAVRFYQDSLYQNRVFYEPQEFRLTRYSTEPYAPSIVFAFSPVVTEAGGADATNSGGGEYNVRLAYRAVPFLPPQVLLQARQVFGPEAAFSALMPATSSLTLQLPDAGDGGTVDLARELATISFEDGIIDELSLPQAQFERIFARFLEPGSVGVQGTLRAVLSDGTPAEIAVKLSLRESAGEVFDRVFKGPVEGSPGVYLVELKNRIESPGTDPWFICRADSAGGYRLSTRTNPHRCRKPRRKPGASISRDAGDRSGVGP